LVFRQTVIWKSFKIDFENASQVKRFW